jgi:4-hydroxybenzoate polyprenyltransferase
VAGFLLAAGASARFSSSLALAASAGLLFYAAGLLVNDVADLEVDRRERPGRPLPSGCISAAAARNAAFLLMVGAMLICLRLGGKTVPVGAALCAAILAYNFRLKKIAVLGPLNMGLCRALNLALGASVVGTASPLLIGASSILTAYVATVTHLARKEAEKAPSGWACWVPPTVLLAAMCFFVKCSAVAGETQFRMAGSFFLAFGAAAAAALRMRAGAAISPEIGRMLGALLFLQAAFCLASGAEIPGLLCGLLLLAMWPLHWLLTRHFYAS